MESLIIQTPNTTPVGLTGVLLYLLNGITEIFLPTGFVTQLSPSPEWLRCLYVDWVPMFSTCRCVSPIEQL